MIVAHGNTPLHDDPWVLNWVSLVVALGPVTALSFVWFWITHSRQGGKWKGVSMKGTLWDERDERL